MPSGWFPDPLGRYDHRYFNGSTWTSDVSTDGRRSVDPLGTSPGNVPADSGNGAATAAVVMGSVGLAIAWIPFIVVVGFVLSVLAVVFGLRGLRRARASGFGRGAAVAGTTMGGMGLALSILGVVLSVLVWREVVRFVEPGPHTVSEVTCRVDGRDIDVEGSITNRDEELRSYTLFVAVADETETVDVDGVEPGATEDWSARLRTFAPISDCRPEITVHGPFPYDLELEPVNSPETP